MTIGTLAATAAVADAPHYDFNLEGQPLKYALRAVTRIAGLELLATSTELKDKQAPPVSGHLTTQEALDALLADSGLTAQISGKAVFIRGRTGSPSATVSSSAERSEPIVVTGSRIKGAPVASLVIRMTQEEMRDAGQATLPDALRQLPQNFGGGQNPGVGLTVPHSENVSGASTINLRGIGGDATLTLLNGHRLSYNVDLQSIDVSSIPFTAIDRVEIVPDGASALYGSDAVAGVANIILRRDYEGVLTSARLGSSTDGGDFQQQYAALAGTRWNGGGIMAAYEFERDTAISANDRSYATDRAPGLQLMPALKHHSATLAAHDSLTPNLEFAVDVLGNTRWNDYSYAIDGRGDYLLNGGRVRSTSTSFAVSPSLTWTPGAGWSATLVGMVGQDHSRYHSRSYVAGAVSSATDYCDCNRAQSLELSANGPTFDLPGGPAKLALGGGYRSNGFSQTDVDLRVSQDTYYVFGEIELPLVSSVNALPLVRQLTVSGAVRYEDYPGVDKVPTPKFGLIYAPIQGLELKGSWGKSFKAPTLYQRYTATRVGLFPALSLGGAGQPSGATAIELAGGNPSLKAERATTWATSIAYRPPSLPGARFELGYFHIDYKDRVVTPVTYASQALSNPIYADLVNANPSASDIDTAVSSGAFFNLTGASFSPASVRAIVDDRYLNAGRQIIHGLDASADYRFTWKSATMTLTGSASYLRSRQQLSPSQPVLALAGTLYNPPHFRARAGFVWNRDRLTFSSFANYVGGLEDIRSTPSIRISSMTTIDLAARYRLDGQSGLLKGVEIALSTQNMLNQKPSLIANTQVYQQPYDPTNYSPIGRFVSFSISKHW